MKKTTWILSSFSLLSSSMLIAVTDTWVSNANGNWSTGTNWTSSPVAPGPGEDIQFTSPLVNNPIIATQDTGLNFSVNTLKIDGSQSYTIPSMAGNSIAITGAVSPNITVNNTNGNAAHMVSAPLSSTSNLVVQQNSTSLFTLSGNINTAAFGFVYQGPNPVALFGVNTFGVPTTYSSGGTLVINSPSSLGGQNLSTGTSASTLQTTATLNYAQNIVLNGPFTLAIGTIGTTTTLSGTISEAGGSQSLTLTGPNGAGTLVLSGNNSYSGGTFITNGTISTASNTNLGTGPLVVTPSTSGGSGGAWLITASYTETARNVMMNDETLIINTQAFNLTLPGVISGASTLSAGIIKQGTGTLTLSGINTFNYLGGTSLQAGTISTNSAASLGTSSTRLFVTSGTWQTTASYTDTRSVLIVGALTIDPGANTLTLNGPGSISGAGTLTKASAGTLVLNNSNSYSGGTTLQLGTISINSGSSLGASMGALTVAGTSTLQSTGTFTDSRNIILNAPFTMDVTAGNTANFSGTISGGVGNTLTAIDTGILVLSGTNTYSGGTIINSGATIQISQDANLGAAGTTLTLNGGTIDAAGNFTSTRPICFEANSFIKVESGNTWTYTGNLTTGVGCTLGFTKNGPGTLALNGNNVAYTQPIVLSAGTISINSATSLGAAANTLTVSGAGTLQASASFTDPHPLIINAPLTIDSQANTLTLSNTLSGTSSLTKISSGTLALTNGVANTYPGGTNLNGGTLSINSATSLGTGALTVGGVGGTLQTTTTPITYTPGITLNAPLTVDTQANTLTLPGNITGTSSLTKISAGTLILQGTNTYGNTTISQGLVQANIPSIPGNNVLLNATLEFLDSAGSGTFSGNISGSGLLETSGGGTLTLSGTNSYTGGTNVGFGGAATTLIGTTSSLQGNIILSNGSILVFNQSTNGTYAGNITNPSGVGQLQKLGSGTVNMTGTSTLTGATTISAGRLSINGSLTTSAVSVSPGAVLGGAGTIIAPVTSNGTIAPGNSIGTLTVSGSAAINAGSTFQAEINPTTASLLNVIGAPGTVTIQPGATLAVIEDAGTYPKDAIYTIIQTTNGVTGTFSTVTNSMPLLNPSVIYLPTSVELQIEFIPIPVVVPTGNIGRLATCLDKAHPPVGSDLSNIIDQLRVSTSVSQLKNSLTQMLPTRFKALLDSQQNNMIRMRSMITQRTEELYISSCREYPENAHFWVDGFGDFTSQDRKHEMDGYHTSTGAGVVGLDYILPSSVTVGGGGGYSHSHVDWNDSKGSGNIQSYYGSLYTTWVRNHFFLTAVALGAYNNYHAHRKIKFSIFDRTADHHTHGWEVAGSLNVGAPLYYKRIDITPYLSGDYIYTHENGFTEHGAGAFDLKIKHVDSSYIRSELGILLARCIRYSQFAWEPYIKLAGLKEWRLSGQNFSAQLTDVDCTFKVHGNHLDRTLFAPGIGVTLITNSDDVDDVSITLRYDAEVGHNYWDQTGNIQINYAF